MKLFKLAAENQEGEQQRGRHGVDITRWFLMRDPAPAETPAAVSLSAERRAASSVFAGRLRLTCQESLPCAALPVLSRPRVATLLPLISWKGRGSCHVSIKEQKRGGADLERVRTPAPVSSVAASHGRQSFTRTPVRDAAVMSTSHLHLQVLTVMHGKREKCYGAVYRIRPGSSGESW